MRRSPRPSTKRPSGIRERVPPDGSWSYLHRYYCPLRRANIDSLPHVNMPAYVDYLRTRDAQARVVAAQRS